MTTRLAKRSRKSVAARRGDTAIGLLIAASPGNFGYFAFSLEYRVAATSAPFKAAGLNLGVAQTFIGGSSITGFALN